MPDRVIIDSTDSYFIFKEKIIFNKIENILFVLLFIVFSAVFCFLFNLAIYADNPLKIKAGEKVVFIEPGSNFSSVASMLSREGIIQEPVKFKFLAFLKGYDKKIKAGEYLFSSQMTPALALDEMVRGRTRLHKLTIPEGYNMRMIASLVADAGFSTKEEFIAAATDAAYARDMGIDAETFEGYLFPDTYFFSKKTTPVELITAMVKRFQSVFSEKLRERAKKINLSTREIVTLASIIEKETGAEFERPIISSVFHNRLKKNMRLESDPTVIYGIKDFDGNITRKHLLEQTAYNTYAITGLPPGPIASPGLKSIEAALYPSETDFLFFVSKNDGSHKFSLNFREHNKAVIKYQKEGRR